MSIFEQNFLAAIRHFQAGNLSEAEAIAGQLLADNPANVGLLQLLGEIAFHQGKNAAAEALFRKAVASNPADAQAHYRLGNVLAAGRRIDEATRCYLGALKIRPDYWQAHINLGLIYRSAGDLGRALEHFGAVLRYNPDSTVTFCYQLDLLLSLGAIDKIEQLRESIQGVVRRCIDSSAERDFFALMYLAPLVSISRQDQAALEASMDVLLSKPGKAVLPAVNPEATRIRIGYVSPDFGDHPVSHVILGLLGEHNRERFEIIAYSTSTRTGTVDQEYIKKINSLCDSFIDLAGKNPQAAAQRIAADEVAILVNLSGYMSPPALEIFSWRPAPLQVYWLGHGGGLGLSFIDYVIADSVVVPPGDESCFREQVLRLPDSYHCTDTPRIAEQPQARTDYGLDKDAFVFCAFNNPNKIDVEAFNAWMNILGRVPDSQIWLSNPTGDSLLEDNLRMAAKRQGVHPDRLVFATRVADKAVHLARHSLADLFIDTFTYNASTTAIDALWAGLPVLTRSGETFYARICASHLANLDLDDMVCSGTREFEDRAVALAQDAGGLASVRQRLERNLQASPLFDIPRFTRHIEAAYCSIWQRHLCGEPPASLDIRPISPGGEQA